MRYMMFALVVLFAVPAFAQFGGLPKVKAPIPTGKPEDVTNFVLSANKIHMDVRTLSMNVSGQVVELSDMLFKVKDMPIPTGGLDKFNAFKKEINDVSTAAKEIRVTDPKKFEESQIKLDTAINGVLLLMKDTLSTEGAVKALSGAAITEVAKKAKEYAGIDANAVKGVIGNTAEALKNAPMAAAALATGAITDQFMVMLPDGVQLKKAEIEGLVKNGKANIDMWKRVGENRVKALNQLIDTAKIK